jgi:hypothetical protein
MKTKFQMSDLGLLFYLGIEVQQHGDASAYVKHTMPCSSFNWEEWKDAIQHTPQWRSSSS